MKSRDSQLERLGEALEPGIGGPRAEGVLVSEVREFGFWEFFRSKGAETCQVLLGTTLEVVSLQVRLGQFRCRSLGISSPSDLIFRSW